MTPPAIPAGTLPRQDDRDAIIAARREQAREQTNVALRAWEGLGGGWLVHYASGSMAELIVGGAAVGWIVNAGGRVETILGAVPHLLTEIEVLRERIDELLKAAEKTKGAASDRR